MPDGPRVVASLAAFLSMETKMLITFLKGNPNMWYNLCEWMNGHLDSMARVPLEPIEAHEPSMQGLQEALVVLINKLGQYFESDNFPIKDKLL